MKIKKGFYTALGTPLDKHGNIIEESLAKHIESQITAGASGLLLMGTMGMLGCIKHDQYEIAVRTAEKVTAGRVRLMVGAADNSIVQIKWKMDILNKYNVCPVLTAPYYMKIREPLIESFFKRVAELTDKEIFLYDHPYTSNVNLTYDAVLKISECQKIKGIKTGNIILAKALHDSKKIKKDFTPILSNSDLFAVGYAYGIEHYLDGIFACFPKTIQRAQDAFNRNDHVSAREALNEMMEVRDFMISVGTRPSFTYAMNLLGFEGNFGPDYEEELSEENKKKMRELLTKIGEM